MSTERKIYKVAIYEMRIDSKPTQKDRLIQSHTQYEQIFSEEQIEINALVAMMNEKANRIQQMQMEKPLQMFDRESIPCLTPSPASDGPNL